MPYLRNWMTSSSRDPFGRGAPEPGWGDTLRRLGACWDIRSVVTETERRECAYPPGTGPIGTLTPARDFT